MGNTSGGVKISAKLAKLGNVLQNFASSSKLLDRTLSGLKWTDEALESRKLVWAPSGAVLRNIGSADVPFDAAKIQANLEKRGGLRS